MAVGTAVVVAVVGVGIYLLVQGGGGPSGSAAGGAQAADGLFTSAPGATNPGIQTTLTDVAAQGNTVVVAGGQAGGSINRGLFLVSRNAGHTWQLADVNTAQASLDQMAGAVVHVAAGPHGWVAMDSNAGTVWTSRDGRSWTQIEGTALTTTFYGASVQAVASTPSGFAAVGGSYATGQAEAWTSPDGVHWTRSSASFGRAPLTSARLAVHGNVLVLYESTIGVPGGAVFWRSPDGGKTWQQAQTPTVQGMPGGVFLNGIAAGPSGFIIYGSGLSKAGSAVVLLGSPDGTQWSVLANAPAPSGVSLGFNGLVADSSGFTASAEAGTSVAVYRSSDGKSWQPSGSMSDVSPYGMGAAAAGSSAVFAAGSHSPNGPPVLSVASPAPASVNLAAISGAIPIARKADSVAVSGGQTVVVGAANGAIGAWYGRGNSWRRAAMPAGPGELYSVTAGSHGWLAAGSGTSTNSHNEFTILSSADGRAWQPVPGQSSFYLPAKTAAAISGVASSRAGYVIVGSEYPPAPIAWFSPDLRSWTGPVTLPASASLPHADVTGIAGGDFGFAAIGAAGNSAGTSRQPVAWLSADGRTWSSLTVPTPAGAPAAAFDKIVATGNTLVIFGTALAGHGQYAAFTDVSRDGGHTWQAAMVPGTQGSLGATAAAAGPAGAAATYSSGSEGAQDVMLIGSTNLKSWQVSKPQAAGVSGPGVQQINALTENGSSLVGVGYSAQYRATHTTLWQTGIP